MVTRVVYSITKQVRQYEPVRVEVEVTRDDGDRSDAHTLIEQARMLAEEAINEAAQRARQGAY